MPSPHRHQPSLETQAEPSRRDDIHIGDDQGGRFTASVDSGPATDGDADYLSLPNLSTGEGGGGFRAPTSA